MKIDKYSVLFVCLGNICRSPTAEAVFRHLVEQSNLSNNFIIDSAGTSDHHVGQQPDARAINHARKRGYDLSKIVARQININNFEKYNVIIAMDNNNYNQLIYLAGQSLSKQYSAKIKLFLSFSQQKKYSEVPDPYYGGEQGFDRVIDLIEDASRGLLQSFQDEFN